MLLRRATEHSVILQLRLSLGLTLSPRALRCDRNLLVVNFPSGLNTRQRTFFPLQLF